MATEKGLVKKTPIQDYANVRKTGLAAIALREDDRLIEVKVTDNTEDILLVTRDGMCIRFNETDVRSTGRVSMGVRGMNLTDNDVVIGMQTASQERICSSYLKKVWANVPIWMNLHDRTVAVKV